MQSPGKSTLEPVQQVAFNPDQFSRGKKHPLDQLAS